MVKINLKHKFSYLPDGTIDTKAWLQKITDEYQPRDLDLIKKAVGLAEGAGQGITTFYGQTCLEQGLEMAELMLELKLDHDGVAAAILTSTIQHTHLKLDFITDRVSENVTKLVKSVIQMNTLNTMTSLEQSKNSAQIDRLRKTFLAMASDIRVILIKLAERLCVMRGIKNINPIERKRLATETMQIYAPLANRLGVGQVKWELEDLAFHYINPETYKTIASFLAERRVEREQRIDGYIKKLREELKKLNITATIHGRAKHIYSIHLKMKRKNLSLNDIFDYSALRILVPTIQDCYTALSVAHQLWEQIPEEFDDYISKPKPNGYRSVHTAVIDEAGKKFEIQIRTNDMHEEAEHGVAAHWVYKENKVQPSGYEAKIALLRELLAWHKDIAKSEEKPNQRIEQILEDRVYVFTPAGDIIDLAVGATPLDFAYHIHSELGHRCRGAKIHGHIAPLTYQLRTGDQVELITIQQGTPSRDWLSKDGGYLHTPRARAKVLQWFKLQDQKQYLETGKNLLEKELSRSAIQHLPLQQIAERLKFKDAESMLIALGRGSVRMANILHAIEQKPAPPTPLVIHTKKAIDKPRSFQVGNTDDLLTRIARCCKPIPGDAIVGYITQGRGVSIHKKDCNNVANASNTNEGRIISVDWNDKHPGAYFADIQVQAYGKDSFLKEITSLLANAKIDLIMLHSNLHKSSQLIQINMTVQISDVTQLSQLLHQIKGLPNVSSAKRISE